MTHLTADGAHAAFSTYLGGSGDDDAFKLDVDLTGNVYVTGETGSSSSTSRATSNAYQPTYGGGTNDDFLTKFTPLRAGNCCIRRILAEMAMKKYRPRR